MTRVGNASTVVSLESTPKGDNRKVAVYAGAVVGTVMLSAIVMKVVTAVLQPIALIGSGFIMYVGVVYLIEGSYGVHELKEGVLAKVAETRDKIGYIANFFNKNNL